MNQPNMNGQWRPPIQNWQNPQQQQWRPPQNPQQQQRPQQGPWQVPPSMPRSQGPAKLPKTKGNPTKKKKIALYLLYGSAILTGIGFLATLAIYLMRY